MAARGVPGGGTTGWWRRRLGTPGDDGQAMTLLVVVGVLGMCLLALRLALPLAEGGDRLGKGQTASEAAALAGAKEIDDHVVAAVLDGLVGVGGLGLGDGCTDYGRSEAERLAAQDDAEVVDYCYRFASDRVQVTTLSRQATSTGHRVHVSAEAETGMPWGRCRFLDLPTPSPSTTTTPPGGPTGPPTPPPPPPDVDVTLHCPDFDLRLTMDGTTHLLHLDPGQLDGLLEPRLTG